MKDLSGSKGAGFHNRMLGGEFWPGLLDAALNCKNLPTVLAVALQAAGRLQFDFPDGSYAAVSCIGPDRYFVEYGELGTGPVQ